MVALDSQVLKVDATVTRFDALARGLETVTPDGQSIRTAYDADRTTTLDQTGVERRVRADALGRIVQVWEPDAAGNVVESDPDALTRYFYDERDNLVEAVQGAQVRSFRYDSLSRLVSETHPESGTTLYRYDDLGNLVSRIDARGKRTDMVYDALSRPLSTVYSDVNNRPDSTPSVTFAYDDPSVPNSTGRVTRIDYGIGADEFLSYDAVGRTTGHRQTIEGRTLTASYGYDAAGGLTSASYAEVNPANYTLVWTHDDRGRQRTFADGSGTFFVTGHRFEHFAGGAFEETFFANGVTERVDFNDRSQPVLRQAVRTQGQVLMSQAYGFADLGGNNDGNLRSVTDLVDSSRSRLYFYDSLKRVESVAGLPWTISYSYDRYGNRLTALGSASTPHYESSSLTYDLQTNRVEGWSYDPAGNLLDDGARSYRWDAAGRLIGIGPPSSPPGPPGGGRSSRLLKNAASPLTSYEYDYAGRRVVKRSPSGDRIYFQDEVLGEVVWEFPLGSPHQDVVRGFFNGRLVLENDTRPGAGLHYFFRDHLGSTQVTADFATPTALCTSFFHPFGQSADASGCDRHVRKFTGKERDPESGLDYFGARYYDSVAGRFISIDPLLDSADPVDPQRWNRYAYVRNNPLIFVDPLGEDIEIAGNQEQRNEALSAFRSLVDLEVAQELSILEEDGKFFLRISDEGRSFIKNGSLGAFITNLIDNNGPTFRVELVPPGTGLEMRGFGGISRPTCSGAFPGATGGLIQEVGVTTVVVDSTARIVDIPGSMMSDGKPGSNDPGIVLAHELGHASILVGTILVGNKNTRERLEESNTLALKFENLARKRRSPSASKRKRHDF